MKVVGLITEYNPFHFGHSHHIEMSRKVTGSDSVVCVMSGNFVQRGEPAIFDKWARAKMGILGGADLIVELPVVYSMASAEFFAYAGVVILNAMGIVDSICFGSESGSIPELKAISDILADEPLEYKELLKKHIDNGISYPQAREKALSDYSKAFDGGGPSVEGIISKSNNILGIEYLKALTRLNSKIEPFTIQRVGNNYNDSDISGKLSSAKSIREVFSRENLSGSVDMTIPNSTKEVLQEELESGRGPVFTRNFDNVVLAMLRSFGREELGQLPYMGEGLHNRLYKALQNASSIEQLVDMSLTKRYTRTRVLRGVMHSLTGLKEYAFNEYNALGGPRYIRVLALNGKGREMLSNMKKKASLPVIVKAADYTNILDEAGKRMFETEIYSTDMYVLGYPAAKKGTGQEFTRNVIRIGL